MFSTRGALPSRHAARLMSSAVRHINCSTGRPSSRSPARFTSRSSCSSSKANTATSISAHHRPQQRRRLERAQPLVAQRVGERVDLEQRLTERIVAPRAARAKREIALAQRLEQIGHRLQRKDDAMAKRRRGERPEHQDGDARRDDRLRGVAARPQQEERCDDAREIRQPPPAGESDGRNAASLRF